ncbi:hypothetical protein PsorP6_005584 [Peronosclerospora sorghi]|uniref:Uncharacterized protein n=1 Tax=Peronosclerospora sorghi TaxID=230839 RepID=A0ACC0W5P0_9STRA|nr:hypothetical protein PsorP6_005584 [Peronosclerospora sorghi]
MHFYQTNVNDTWPHQQLQPCLKTDYPNDIPASRCIMEKLYPNLGTLHLYLRVHSPKIYHDPIKIATLSGLVTSSFFQYASFPLWSNEVLKALWNGILGEHYDALLPNHVAAAVGLITSTTQDIEDADMGETPRTSATSEANNLFSQFTLVAIQETKFSSSDAVRRVTHFSKVCDSKSISFWSHPTTPEFSVTRRRDGVDLLLSRKHPFQTVTNVTHQYVTFSSSTLLSHRYLVIQARTDDINLCIHVVYAPVQVADRKDFLMHFQPDSQKTAITSSWEISTSQWTPFWMKLGITDAWRNWWPDKRELAVPGRKKRIYYVFLSPTLLSDYLVGISHVTDRRFHPEDHLPVTFTINSPNQPATAPLPWKCPRCILQNPYVQRVLEYNLDQLCDKMRCDERSIAVDCLTNTNEQTPFFLGKWSVNSRTQTRQSSQRLYDAETAHLHSPNEITTRNIADATAELETFVEEQNARRQQVKFDFDVRCGETGGKTLFHTPYISDMRVTIPNVRLDNGTLSETRKRCDIDPQEILG